MRIALNRRSEDPLYQQIVAHIKSSITAGSLPPDSKLPSSRELAQDLGVSRVTIVNAYAELEADGLIEARPGSGTYVLEPYTPLQASATDRPWPLWQQRLQENIVDNTPAPPPKTAISFAGGGGDPRLFPLADWRRSLQQILNTDGISALQYGAPGGYPPLRYSISQMLASQGLQTNPENILITSGSQQAISLALQLLLEPGDSILVENPTYALALGLFKAHKLKLITIPMDAEGMMVEQLESLLQRHRPKLIYTIPNFHNPTGACMRGHRRHILLNLADYYNIPILEDDFIGDLRYEGSAEPALKALDSGGRVIYTSTFSKMLMPGLRVGFMITEGPSYDSLVSRKYAHDLATSNLMQHALNAYVSVGRYQNHLRRSRRLYRQRRDAMLACIERYLPGSEYSKPLGGLFLWLRLPEKLDAERLLPFATRQDVAFAPGRRFFVDHITGSNYVRLNFAMHTPAEIEEGIKRLGKAIYQFNTRL